MKCPHCGVGSEVLETRKHNGVFLRRTRLCLNDHRFYTFEVFSGNIDRRTLQTTVRGIKNRARSYWSKRVILTSEESPATLARRLNVSTAWVRMVRAKHQQKRST